MKDLNTDPRVQALPESIRPKFIKKAEEQQAAILWDTIAEEYAEANEARAVLPTIKAEMTALRRAVDRPINVALTQPKPATAKKPQKVLPASRLLAANMTAQMMHKLGGNKPETNLTKLLPGDEHRIARKLAKSATVPGTTTDASWGADLVRSDVGAFYRSLKERSAVAQLAELGTSVDFGGNSSITFPHRGANDDGSLKPAFVQERATIPVSSAALGSTTMNKFKLGIITLATDELIRVPVWNPASHARNPVETGPQSCRPRPLLIEKGLIAHHVTVTEALHHAAGSEFPSNWTPLIFHPLSSWII